MFLEIAHIFQYKSHQTTELKGVSTGFQGSFVGFSWSRRRLIGHQMLNLRI
jgi:hypothetical protein